MTPREPAARRRCAVIGSPIAHSLSPVLHRAGYAAAGLDWCYDAVEVTEPALASFLDGLDDTWRGLSLTMPLKRAVVPLVHELSTRAAQAAAANTVVFEDGHRTGHNTDILGAVAAVRERVDGPVDHAVILGGGATAASTLLALADLGCTRVGLVVRDARRAAETVAAAGRHPAQPRVELRGPDEPPAAADLLVSTIPAAAQVPFLPHAAAAAAVFDVVYDPWPTPLARHAREHGQALVSGLDLLVHQAGEQFTLFTGAEAPLEEMRAAGEGALADR